MRFKFEEAFKRPTKIINDVAMQALGSYRKGKMLFLGLGTGLGSTLIADGILEPMELGHCSTRRAHIRTMSAFGNCVSLAEGNGGNTSPMSLHD
jgi:predicted NBD/HSP70 family sugar kinase